MGFKEIAVGKKTKTGQLYERGQLLPTRLGGATADTRNIFTTTNQLNQLLAKKTKQISNYLESHPQNHVRYRISAVYKDQEIIARGVCLEAQSVEDNGLSFYVYLLNTQSGIVINYSNGEAKVII
ncbi:DNA/RNA non-specific endonuclease [Bombilactobacillus bombi]|nr:DNA/RNA non-specific endonuclease [Bombilactobacillus bombi]